MPGVRQPRWKVAGGTALISAALVLVGVDLRVWNWPVWAAAGGLIRGHWLTVTASAAAIAGLTLVVSVWAARRAGTGASPDRTGRSQAELGWLTSYRGLAAVFVVISCAGLATMVVMLVLAGGAGHYEGAGNSTQLRVEAIKYGLGSIAAAGAAVGLLLSVRRQRVAESSHDLAERTLSHTQADADRRRVTELFTTAVELLGHTDAAVRLGSLYALERVADDDHGRRKTVVDVLCAYLRMPYKVPSDFAPAGGTAVLKRFGLTAETPPAQIATTRDPRQELQVRLAAQRILTRILAEPPAPGTDGPTSTAPGQAPAAYDLDLSRAVLVSFGLERARLGSANFTGTVFVGETRISGTTVDGRSWFGGAVFTYSTQFIRVTFGDVASFERTTFGGDVKFDRATFDGGARFDGLTFTVGSIDFQLTGVRPAPTRVDVWPPGWRVDGTGALVR